MSPHPCVQIIECSLKQQTDSLTHTHEQLTYSLYANANNFNFQFALSISIKRVHVGTRSILVGWLELAFGFYKTHENRIAKLMNRKRARSFIQTHIRNNQFSPTELAQSIESHFFLLPVLFTTLAMVYFGACLEHAF